MMIFCLRAAVAASVLLGLSFQTEAEESAESDLLPVEAQASSAATLLELAPADETRGLRPTTSAAARPVGKQWALIIGVNYAGRQAQLGDADRSTLKPLKNAVHDAEGVRDVLRDYYGYQDTAPGVRFEGDDQVALLTEAEATDDAIETALGDLAAQVSGDDSVLLFFSGHGVRLADLRDRVAILPYDVQLARGAPTAKQISLRQLFKRLAALPARHKLVVLDCCYSGEIFHGGFQPRSESDVRSDRRLQSEESFQAIASCRATQVASDGVDGHSPFTAALIEGLKRLPANDDSDRRVWTDRLFAYVRPRFIGTGQVPDCRSLNAEGDKRFDGEFCFYPGEPRLFDKFRFEASDQNLLRALVASGQGNWWFQEMPWFIPSLRDKVLNAYKAKHVASRDLSELIDPTQLREIAVEAAKDFERADAEAAPGVGEAESVHAMRNRHFKLLLETQHGDSFNETLKAVAQDIEARYRPERPTDEPSRSLEDGADGLTAADVHLLAVVCHSLGQDEQAAKYYEAALTRYDRMAAGDVSRLVEALCRADFGEFLLDQLDKPAEAAIHFRRADEQVVSLTKPAARMSEDEKPRGIADIPHPAAAVFRVFILCREADAWLEQNRWSEANDRLLEASDLANVFASEHYLAAHVHRRRAWAQLIQWDIAEAEGSFRRSNEILAKRAAHGVGSTESAAAGQTGLSQTVDASAAGTEEPLPDDGPFAVTESLRTSTDFASKLAYLHNLHGLAMAARFRGDTALAADKYRWLISHVEDNLFRLRNAPAGVDVVDLETKLLERLINTKERLGDCNLFGDPRVRDLEEAADDYRRALMHVHQLRGRKRDQWRSILLYKQALALALPSPTQDTELALEMCRRADEIFATQRDTATGLYQALGLLTTRTVEVVDAAGNLPTADARPSAPEAGLPSAALSEQPAETPTARLREAIHAFRDEIGRSPHRDQLELCLFASAVLLEHGRETDRFQVVEDVDLLLSFTRLALAPYRLELADGRPSADSRAYLRPYYDAAMRARISGSGKGVAGIRSVKELLEIHWEATRGTPWVKQEKVSPVLAVYVLDDQGFLLVDLPGGESRCVPLADHCDLAALRGSCQKDSQAVPLPLEVQKHLLRWKTSSACDGACVDSWLDEASLRTKHVLTPSIVPGRGPLGTDEKSFSLQFPFGLPDGFTIPVAEAASK